MQPTRTLLEVLFSRKMAALLLLGFSSGLPLYLVGKTLQAWLTVAGVDIGTIGWFGLVSLPYTLKFVWAPLVDRYSPPLFGRRRGWIALSQIGLALALAGLALTGPGAGLGVVAAFAVLIAFLSATQDIAFDGYRAEVLDPEELGNGSAVGVYGYRVALLLTGSAALALADLIGWPTTYLLLAALVGCGVGATAWAAVPAASAPPQSLVAAVTQPLADFFGRNGAVRGLLLLVFIVLYKLSDGLAANMATTFLLKTGFTSTDLGVFGGIGFGAVTLGLVVGGVVLTRLGIARCLWLFAGLQGASNLCYFTLALLGQNYWFGTVTAAVENFCAGLVTAAFVAFLTGQCNPRYAATQYALLSSLMAFGTTVAASPAGALAQAVGWPVFFALTALAVVPAFLLLPLFASWKAENV